VANEAKSPKDPTMDVVLMAEKQKVEKRERALDAGHAAKSAHANEEKEEEEEVAAGRQKNIHEEQNVEKLVKESQTRLATATASKTEESTRCSSILPNRAKGPSINLLDF
jgi:hypothetical protein